MAIGFPVGFVGPLPSDGYYNPSMTMAEYSGAASPGFGIVPEGTIYSNYDAPTLQAAVNGIPSSYLLPSGTVTYTTNVGQFEELIAGDAGITANFTSTVTVTGDEGYVQSQISEVLLIVPPNYQGNITITETWTEPTPLTRDVTVPVVPYDDGSYEASLQSLKTLVSSPGTPSIASPQQALVSPAVARTGVRGGIDWSTLVSIKRDSAQATDPGTGTSYLTTGNIWQVKTVKGTTLTVLEADPLAQQPAASRAIPTFQDPSYNCHGYTFGATGVVCPDDRTRSFEIINAADVNAILSESYTLVTTDQAYAAAGTKNLYFVFFKNGSPVHSAVNSPGQSFFRTTAFGITIGLGTSTVVSSKNGDLNFQGTTTIKALQATYPGTDVKIYVAKP